MKKTTYFRIELCEGATSLCDTITVLAAKANGGKAITLQQLKIVADGALIQYPILNDDVTIEMIGDNVLHVDRKIGDEYRTVCRIEEVELLGKVVDFETENDIPEELYHSPVN